MLHLTDVITRLIQKDVSNRFPSENIGNGVSVVIYILKFCFCKSSLRNYNCAWDIDECYVFGNFKKWQNIVNEMKIAYIRVNLFLEFVRNIKQSSIGDYDSIIYEGTNSKCY